MQENNNTPDQSDISLRSMDSLKDELTKIQESLDMLYTMYNSLEDLDISHGGGGEQAQQEYQKLDGAQRAIVTEINKRHMLAEIK